ncbi:hypothetical protein [Arthrobacter sp. EpRS71]|uniref:hypothetical protein n=1 Tax=Arthrobacter sp. EpRS71 TaxID=1743141 RepID=UPI000746A77A|nr:hypothetical protein [Arthrobacter sp. EpRS71]KUM35211.1 hypothetical protein AR689_14205 [Arthrobacter sp. EpRS71]
MVPVSPAAALGEQANDVRPLLVDVVRYRHDRSAEAHQVSESRYGMGFGSQWRDLLDDVQDAMKARGYRTYRLPPAGYKLPVVNDCLVYVWRVPDSVDAISSFASSPTRLNGFAAELLDPTLFEPGFTGEPELTSVNDSPEVDELGRVVRAADDVMPLVLVMIQSTPRQLQSIVWAVAELDKESGDVRLHGQETLWAPQVNVDDAAIYVESFDSGTPNEPKIAPQEQEGTQPDA